MKSISVSDDLHTYIMDHKTSELKSAGAVIMEIINTVNSQREIIEWLEEHEMDITEQPDTDIKSDSKIELFPYGKLVYTQLQKTQGMFAPSPFRK